MPDCARWRRRCWASCDTTTWTAGRSRPATSGSFAAARPIPSSPWCATTTRTSVRWPGSSRCWTSGMPRQLLAGRRRPATSPAWRERSFVRAVTRKPWPVSTRLSGATSRLSRPGGRRQSPRSRHGAGTRAVVVAQVGPGLRWSPSSGLGQDGLGHAERRSTTPVGQRADRRGPGPPAAAPGPVRRIRSRHGRMSRPARAGRRSLAWIEIAKLREHRLGDRGRRLGRGHGRSRRCGAPSPHRYAGTQARGRPPASDRSTAAPVSRAASPP